MKTVDKLQLGSIQYDIDFNFDGEASDKWGWHDPRKSYIGIQHDLTDDHKKTIFLHELLHAGFYLAGVDMIDKAVAKNEEAIIHLLSVQLSSFFKQNPELKEVLFD